MPSPARVTGTVVHGNGRGKELGFPTANLRLDSTAPTDGVYSAWVRIGDRWHGATVSVGDNPTFRNVGARRMECHVHDLSEDLYGQEVAVEIVAFLREMVAFSGADELIERTAQDVARSREILRTVPRPQSGIAAGFPRRDAR